ncbi:unnamed protein product, partial [Mesorhabditis spiculigera]
MQKLKLAFCFALIFGARAAGEDDRVTNLPGINFATNYGLYSGYLNAGNNGTWKMHYWLIESKSKPANDPVLVWFQGGPGCSSFGGAFEELGPFYINYDQQTLFENKYSWNANANILFLESPIGVGFSYDSTNPDYSHADDTQTQEQNYRALADFFSNVQPRFKNSTFFLSGESYAGVYIPMLSALLTTQINANQFPNPNFEGAAIGNGFMHVPRLFNSLVLWAVYHGKVALNDWDYIKANCKGDPNVALFDVDNYNFFSYLISTNGMDFVSDNSKCGNYIYNAISIPDPDYNDAYNYYQDCYNPDFFVNPFPSSEVQSRHPALKHRIKKRSIMNMDSGVNTANLFNYDSSDNQLAYPCWNWIAVRKYANRDDVQKALHIADDWRKAGNNGQNRLWQMCNKPMYDSYKIDFNDQQPFFHIVLSTTKNPNFRFLIYNGDIDTVCNFLGDSWFARQVAQDNGFDAEPVRTEWTYRRQTAGYVQRYTRKADQVKIDVVTVKGAGHMVPNDRPAQSLQLMQNFMFPNGANKSPNYNSTDNANPTPSLAPFLGTGSNQQTSQQPIGTTTKSTSLITSSPFLVLLLLVLALRNRN